MGNQQIPSTLRAGDSGPLVLVWQRHGLVPRALLREDQVTGTMDPATVRATVLYQSARGLHPDGIVGPRTWGYAGFVADRERLDFGKKPTRKKAIRFQVIHHSVTRLPLGFGDEVDRALRHYAAARTAVDRTMIRGVFDVLVGRGLSTHHIVGPFGLLETTLDPDAFRAAHAGDWNDRSEGWDIAAPLDEDAARGADRALWPERTAPWAPASDGHRYRADRDECLIALAHALEVRCEQTGVPFEAPARMEPLGIDPETAPPGVYAHGHFGNRWDGFAALTRMHELGIGPRLV